MPKWAESTKYDIQAKVDEANVAAVAKLPYALRLVMLQALLVDRFRLAAHIEERMVPIYALVVAKNGPRFKATSSNELPDGRDKDIPVVTGSRPGEFSAINLPIAGVTESMDSWVDRPVVDKTGLAGRYDIQLKWSPETSPSRRISVPNVEPTAEQRLMLQTLLRDRFGFKSHFETKGEMYTSSLAATSLSSLRHQKTLDQIREPSWVIKQGGIADGEAEGTNTTTDYLAQRLGRYLRLPVLNETGITGSYDFDLSTDDPENNDIVSAIHNVVDRLGLKLKPGRGLIQTLFIDQVQQPSEN